MIEDHYNSSRAKAISWLVVLVVGMVTWYYIGYFSNKIYHRVVDDSSKPSFRYTPLLLER